MRAGQTSAAEISELIRLMYSPSPTGRRGGKGEAEGGGKRKSEEEEMEGKECDVGKGVRRWGPGLLT